MIYNPSIRIALRSHTDSGMRTVPKKHLGEQGSYPSRITAKGYGERELVNKCAYGVDRTEAEHQVDRRTEFIITDCKDRGVVRSAK